MGKTHSFVLKGSFSQNRTYRHVQKRGDFFTGRTCAAGCRERPFGRKTRLKTTQRVEELVKGVVETLGFELCDVEFQKEYGSWVLTLYIDRPEGVNIDDCERVSKAVDPILDEADPIEQAYMLSVSSLGLDRPLKKDADFARNIGKRIEVKLYSPLDGKKEFVGELIRFDEASATILLNGAELVLERKSIALARPELVF